MKRHDLDPASFVFGLLFVLLALFFLIGDQSIPDIGPWIWPVTILTLGLLIVLYAAKRILSTAREREALAEADEPEDEPAA